MGMIDLITGIKQRDEADAYGFDINEEWDADAEGNLKLQKIIRKKLQYDDDPNEPFGFRKGKSETGLAHALRMKFGSSDDARKQKSPEHIQKMLNARKKVVKEYIENL